MQSFTSVPFKSEHSHGFVSVSGVAKFSSAGVILEFESKIIGLIPGGIKEARLPIGEILDVKFKKGVLKRGAKIEIRLKSFARLNDVPHEDGKLTLKLVADDNVPPYNTLLVVDALIKANKDFDLLMIPNARHGYGAASNYMMRRRWDYFVKNLLGMEPPKEYVLSPKPDPRAAQ